MKCSYPKSAHILCMLCASKHSSKPAYTVLATYMHPSTQACAYSASCVHASTHSILRILCKLCTCIHPLNPAHTLQAVYIQTPHASLHASLHASSACKVCMYRRRHACACRACMQRVLHVESACRTCRFAFAYMHAKNNALLYCCVVWSLVDLGYVASQFPVS
jgi:hypothetical protein